MAKRKGYKLDEAGIREIRRHKRWIAKLDISGPGVTFKNTKEGASAYIQSVPLTPRPSSSGQYFTARITGNTRDGSNWRWTYAFIEVTKTGTGYGGWTDKSGGRSGSGLLNLNEDQNGASGTLGNGVTTTNLDTTDYTFTPQPIPTGTRVRVWAEVISGTAEYLTDVQNGIDGTCD